MLAMSKIPLPPYSRTTNHSLPLELKPETTFDDFSSQKKSTGEEGRLLGAILNIIYYFR